MEALYDFPLELQKAIFSSIEELFDLPLQVKLRNSWKKPYHAYLRQYPHVPLYERMGIDGANILEKTESFTEVMWPEGNPSFSYTVQPFAQHVAKLDIIVRKRMVLESLGLEKYFQEHTESTNYLLRVMKYKGPQTPDTKLGLDAHTDENIVTRLHQNQVDGLEILTKCREWISVKPSEGSFIVMVGDSFHAWTNRRVHSPFRVMMTGNMARNSAGLFSIPHAGYIIKAPEELVDEEHPLLFTPFDHVAFFGYYYTPAGQQDQSALKIYCGVRALASEN